MTIRQTVVLGLASLSIIVFSGCLMSRQHAGDGLDHNASFMDAWNAYVHCLSSKEPEAIVSDLHALNRFTDSVPGKGYTRPLGILPYSLPPLPSRLAVDPTAMVTACANHGMEVALSLEQPEGSVELLITAVEAQHHSREALQ